MDPCHTSASSSWRSAPAEEDRTRKRRCFSVTGLALVHDYLLVLRGAERTFAAISDCWPGAPIYTTLYSEEGTGGRFSRHPVSTSFLQRLGAGQRTFRRLLPLFPAAVQRLPVQEHDVVVSSSSAFAHGVVPGESATQSASATARFAMHGTSASWRSRRRRARSVRRSAGRCAASATGTGARRNA